MQIDLAQIVHQIDDLGANRLFTTHMKKRDFYSGFAIMLLGSAVTLDSTSYDLGSLTHMGPGMFPLLLGIVLLVIGIMIFGVAIASPLGPDEAILPRQKEWVGWACILAGPSLFIVLGHYFGMAPAAFSCVFVSALGDRTATVRSSFLLALTITVSGCLLFSYILRLPFPLLYWGI